MNENTTVHIYFHRADFDGLCSGAIARRHFKDRDVALHPADYGDSAEEMGFHTIGAADTVVMLDFSLPYDDMKALKERCADKLTWIDHHKTAIDELESLGLKGVRDTTKAACELAWEYFNPDTDTPPAVYLLGRYDVWKHEDDDRTMPFQYGLRMRAKLDLKDTIWDALLDWDDKGVDVYERIGRYIITYEETTNAAIARDRAFEATMDGLNLIVLNTAGRGSKLFESVFDPRKHDAMMVFGMTPDGNYSASLYSYPDKGGPNVGEICKARGGGGHPGAAGFRFKEIPFIRKGETDRDRLEVEAAQLKERMQPIKLYLTNSPDAVLEHQLQGMRMYDEALQYQLGNLEAQPVPDPTSKTGWLERATAEATQLADRLEKLTDFLANGELELDPLDRNDLFAQRDVMVVYSGILNRRIQRHLDPGRKMAARMSATTKPVKS